MYGRHIWGRSGRKRRLCIVAAMFCLLLLIAADSACIVGKEHNFNIPAGTDAALYAGQTASIDVCHVTYDLTNLDGSAYVPEAAVQTYTCGQGLILPVPVSEREDFAFSGWYGNADYTGRKYTWIPETETGDKTYYAYFKDAQKPEFNGTALLNVTNGDAQGMWFKKGENSNQPAIYVSRCKDNVGIENVSVRVDNGSYTTVGVSAYADVQGYCYALQEGEHTYQFKLADVEGNEKVSENRTIRYDGTKPEIGEITYEKKTSSVSGWIIGRDSLVIEIPVSDSGSGVRCVTYTETTMTAEGETSEQKMVALPGRTGEQMVELQLDAGWKGKINDITCIDMAGNVSDSKVLRADDGGEISGIIVEDNPPMIAIVEADMGVPTDPRPGNPVSAEYYDAGNVPALYVSVEDEGMEGTEVSAGIEKITYTINDGAEVEAPGNFAVQMTGSHHFTIPLAGYTGVVSVTVSAADHAGNTASANMAVKIKDRQATPPY